MKVYVTEKKHYKFNFLVNWQNPDNGAIIGQWFTSWDDILDYTADWDAEYILVEN